MVNYTKNKIIVHYDDKVMPKKKANWCSWNFCYDEDKLVLTYWMNLLQNLKIKKKRFIMIILYLNIIKIMFKNKTI